MKKEVKFKVREAFNNAIQNAVVETIHSSFEGSFDGAIQDKLLFVNGNRLFTDKKVAYQKISSAAKNVTKKTRDLKGSLAKESRLLVGVVDPFREYIDGGVLEEGQAIIHNSLYRKMKKYANEDGTIDFAALRSPTCGEFYKGKLLSVDMMIKNLIDKKDEVIVKMVEELKQKLEENGKELSEEQIAHICERRFFHCIEKLTMLDINCVMVTGSEYFKSCTGGSDFDTDKFCIFVGPDLIFFENRKNFSVAIPAEMGEGELISFKGRHDMLNKTFHMLLKLTTTTVDEQMMLQSRIVAFISSILEGNEESALAMDKVRKNLERVQEEHTNKEYIRLFSDDEDIAEGVLSNAFFKNMFKAFVDSNRSNESILNYLLDCVHIGAAVGGMTIDMAKTALDLFSPFIGFMDGISQKRRSNPSLVSFIKNEGLFVFATESEEREYKDEKRKQQK